MYQLYIYIKIYLLIFVIYLPQNYVLYVIVLSESPEDYSKFTLYSLMIEFFPSLFGVLVFQSSLVLGVDVEVM